MIRFLLIFYEGLLVIGYWLLKGYRFWVEVYMNILASHPLFPNPF